LPVHSRLLCTGKIYFDLLEHKEKHGRDDVAIVRMEQLYPYPMQQMDTIFSKYAGTKVRWVQEEPQNMGAWQYLNSFWRDASIEVISRKVSASPATGYKKVHEDQQAAIVKEAFSQ
ncbi:MAG: 2-oxoglutarate dehydrogenase E1 component, partial [Bacteroidota bacterium]